MAQDGTSNIQDSTRNAQDGARNAQKRTSIVQYGASNARKGARNSQKSLRKTKKGVRNAQKSTSNAQDGASNAQDGASNVQNGASKAQDGASNEQNGESNNQNNVAVALLTRTFRSLRFEDYSWYLPEVKPPKAESKEPTKKRPWKTTALHQAVSDKSLPAAKAVPKKRSLLNLQNERGNTALHLAVMTKNKAVFKFLLKRKAR